jgi:hypothetical protein
MTHHRSLTEVEVCWNPATAEVALLPWPDRLGRDRPYLFTAGACETRVHDFTHLERQAYVLMQAVVLIIRDGCDPQAVHRALLGITEYRDLLPDDMPGVTP